MAGAPHQVDVAIVGAGPTGTALTLLLGARGRRVALIEQHAEPYALPRAVHVDDEALRILHEIGIGEQFAAVSVAGLGLRLVDRRQRVLAQFERSASTVSGLPEASMFDQPDLERLLRGALEAQPTVEVLLGREVTGLEDGDDGPVLRLRTPRCRTPSLRTPNGAAATTVSARFVVGADGANSLIRRALGSGVTDLGFHQRWLVVDVRSRRQPRTWDGVHQLADHRRAGTFMRVGPGRYRWEFHLLPGESAGEYQSVEALRPLIDGWLGEVGDDDLELIRSVEYTFRAQVASTWRRGQVLLAGDAAHLTPPFIGQGLCSGLRDAANLGWKLDAALEAEGADRERLLESYEAERGPHATRMIRRAVLLGRLMSGGGVIGSGVRALVTPVVARMPHSAAAVLDSATPALVGGPMLPRIGPPALCGSLFPLVRVGSPSDGGAELIDRRLGSGVALVARAMPAVVLPPGVRVVLVDPEGDGAGAGEAHLERWFEDHGIGWVIVRPDRVIMAAGRTAQQLDSALALPAVRAALARPAMSARS